MKTCISALCSKSVFRRDLCFQHYKQVAAEEGKVCTEGGCEGYARHRGLCDNHHARLQRNGHTGYQPKAGKAVCSVDGCVAGVKAKSLCGNHYALFRAYGRTHTLTLLDRFEALVIKADDPDACWAWKGAPDKDGYGYISVDGKGKRAHRIAYELFVGPIPEGKIVRHTCDNPPCCNWRHLLPGTNTENMADRTARGRARTRWDTMRERASA